MNWVRTRNRLIKNYEKWLAKGYPDPLKARVDLEELVKNDPTAQALFLAWMEQGVISTRLAVEAGHAVLVNDPDGFAKLNLGLRYFLSGQVAWSRSCAKSVSEGKKTSSLATTDLCLWIAHFLAIGDKQCLELAIQILRMGRHNQSYHDFSETGVEWFICSLVDTFYGTTDLAAPLTDEGDGLYTRIITALRNEENLSPLLSDACEAHIEIGIKGRKGVTENPFGVYPFEIYPVECYAAVALEQELGRPPSRLDHWCCTPRWERATKAGTAPDDLYPAVRDWLTKAGSE
jgi:hypothetical protein